MAWPLDGHRHWNGYDGLSMTKADDCWQPLLGMLSFANFLKELVVTMVLPLVMPPLLWSCFRWY